MAAMSNPAGRDDEAHKSVVGGEDRRSVIVTGASRGIGAAIARLVGAKGFPVLVNFATDRAAAEEVVRAIVASGGRAVAIQGDVSREEEILQLFETAARKFGPIGGLVNNAGVTGGFSR